MNNLQVQPNKRQRRGGNSNSWRVNALGNQSQQQIRAAGEHVYGRLAIVQNSECGVDRCAASDKTKCNLCQFCYKLCSHAAAACHSVKFTGVPQPNWIDPCIKCFLGAEISGRFNPEKHCHPPWLCTTHAACTVWGHKTPQGIVVTKRSDGKRQCPYLFWNGLIPSAYKRQQEQSKSSKGKGKGDHAGKGKGKSTGKGGKGKGKAAKGDQSGKGKGKSSDKGGSDGKGKSKGKGKSSKGKGAGKGCDSQQKGMSVLKFNSLQNPDDTTQPAVKPKDPPKVGEPGQGTSRQAIRKRQRQAFDNAVAEEVKKRVNALGGTPIVTTHEEHTKQVAALKSCVDQLTPAQVSTLTQGLHQDAVQQDLQHTVAQDQSVNKLSVAPPAQTLPITPSSNEMALASRLAQFKNTSMPGCYSLNCTGQRRLVIIGNRDERDGHLPDRGPNPLYRSNPLSLMPGLVPCRNADEQIYRINFNQKSRMCA